MRPSIAPTSHPDEKPTKGFRHRVKRLLGMENSPKTEESPDSESSENLIEKLHSMEPYDAERIRRAFAKQHGISAKLKPFFDPELDIEEAFGLIRELNREYGPDPGKHQGRKHEASVALPNGFTLNVKFFPDNDDAISFGLSRHS